MKKKETPAGTLKTKTTVNDTATKNVIKNTKEAPAKNALKKTTIPVVKDIDEGSPERK